MKATPGTLQEGGARFDTTHWTVVQRAVQMEPTTASKQAMADFARSYWPPLYTFLRRSGRTPSDAQDLVQGFFAHLLAHETLTRADRDKGRLRTFLLGSLQHYLANVYDRTQTVKRGGGQQIVSIDEYSMATEAAMGSVNPAVETGAYDRAWVGTLVSRAWEGLQKEFAAEGKSQILAGLKPFLLGGTTIPSQEEVAAKLDVPFATFRTLLRRSRQRYREALRREVARTVADPAEVEDELHYLYQLLVR